MRCVRIIPVGVQDGSAPNWLAPGSIRLWCRRSIRCWSVTAWSLSGRHEDRRPTSGSSGRSPNDLWQIDATRIVLADNTEVWVVDVIDDHSRYLLAAIAGPAATGDLAWDAFEIAASRYGLPRQVLSDNGLIFTGRLHGTAVAFEVSLKELGIELINSAPYHPQTLGKLERFHRTVKEWLTDEGPAETLEHLQELLDGFRFHYNRQRPHQGIDDQTPAERYGIVSIDPDVIRLPGPDDMTEPTYPPDAYVRKVGDTGNIGFRGKLIHVGIRYATAQVRVIEVDRLVHIYHGDDLIRALTINPDRYYQPKGGRQPPRQRQKCHVSSKYKVSHIIPVQTHACPPRKNIDRRGIPETVPTLHSEELGGSGASSGLTRSPSVAGSSPAWPTVSTLSRRGRIRARTTRRRGP